MSWPTTQAGTTHLDSGSDNPGSARADIKQNVDNVNDILDLYNSSGPYATAGTYTKQQVFGMATLTDAASITWNLETQQTAQVTLTDNRALANPTNKVAGATYVLIVKQDGSGSQTLSYGSEYKFPGGTAPTLSTGANDVDVLCFVSVLTARVCHLYPTCTPHLTT